MTNNNIYDPNNYLNYQNYVINELFDNLKIFVTCITFDESDHEINDHNQLITMLINNEVSKIRIHSKFTEIISIKQLFDLLKFNTSVRTIHFMLGRANIDIYEEYCEALLDMLKVNKSVKNLYIYYKYMSSNMLSHLVNTLKINNTIADITMDISKIDYKHVANILTVNNTLKTINIFLREVMSQDILQINYVFNALENNRSIIQFYTTFEFTPVKTRKEVLDICNRNKYNNKLKRLVLGDL
jgi:hypothetical protein